VIHTSTTHGDNTRRDSYGRAIDYLRVSVTDRCNLRCVYCMPEEGVPWRPHSEILRYEEIARLARVAATLGVSHIRLTGGEPLVRQGLPALVKMLAEVPGIDELSMTTNGTLLAQQAKELARAGLNRVNVSLDTLDAEQFRQITRWGELDDALRGISAAREAGLTPVKINVVVIRGTNDDQIVDMARRTLSEGWHVRFIEYMPMGPDAPGAEVMAIDAVHVPAQEMRERIESELGRLYPASLPGSGPASYWRLDGAGGTIGFISALSEHFCAHCNRLRLTADGHLLPCLMGSTEFDLRTPLRQGAEDRALRALFVEAIEAKPAGHCLADHVMPGCRPMSRIGG
jgi:cyclic pyranopterin phosphate synthase